MRYSSYELKYCERCGGLGLRRSKSGQPYCVACEQMMHRFSLKARAAAPPIPGGLRRIVLRLGPASATGAAAREAVYAS